MYVFCFIVSWINFALQLLTVTCIILNAVCSVHTWYDGFCETVIYIILNDVLYVPELSYNLLSVAQATKFRKSVKFNGSTFVFISEGTNIGSTSKFGSLYYLNYQFDGPEERTNSIEKQNSLSAWHQRYGHLKCVKCKKSFPTKRR